MSSNRQAHSGKQYLEKIMNITKVPAMNSVCVRERGEWVYNE